MKKIILFCYIFSYTICFSQNDSVLAKEIIVGKSFINNSEIKGAEFTFPERIYHTYIDSSGTFVTIQLRGVSKNEKWYNKKGQLLVCDLHNKSLLWSKKINYKKNNIKQFGDFIFIDEIRKISLVNLITGEKKWETQNKIFHVNAAEKVGIGYDYINPSLGFSNKLKGIDINTGIKLWEREINRDFGWNNFFYLDDSTLLVVASGLHSINIRTGLGWDYKMITGEKDYRATIAKNAAGVALGLLTGTLILSTGYNVVSNVASNVIVDTSNIYFAARDKISCLNKNGILIWSVPLSKDLMSESSIFIKDSLIYLINEGHANYENREIKYGKPFIACFSKNTGKQFFLNIIKNDKKINSYSYNKKDTICILFNDRITKYYLANGEKLNEKIFDKDTLGEFYYFIGEKTYYKDNKDEYKSMYLEDSINFFIYTKAGNILELNNDFSINKILSVKDIFNLRYKINDYKILTNGSKLLVISNAGKAVVEVKATKNIIKKQKTLLDVKENNLIIINLKNVIDN